jgi:hypothetical protein
MQKRVVLSSQARNLPFEHADTSAHGRELQRLAPAAVCVLERDLRTRNASAIDPCLWSAWRVYVTDS